MRYGERVLDEYADDDDAFRTTDAAQIAVGGRRCLVRALAAQSRGGGWRSGRVRCTKQLLELRPRNADVPPRDRT